MKYLLAHDIGTSGNKASLFSQEGKLIKSVTHSYPVNWFNNGWAEQNPESWYEAVCQTTQIILKECHPKEIVALSFSGQMMGCLCVNKDGIPLQDAMIWADRRALVEEKQIKSSLEPFDFYQRTGHRPSASYSLAKFMWIKNNKPNIYRQTHKMLNAKDYIIFKLTGNFLTDYSDASGTNLFNINRFEWDDEIISKNGIDIEKLPEIAPSTKVAGEVTYKASKESGLLAGTPIVLGGGDGVMSAIGALSVSDGDLFTTVGTSAWNGITKNEPLYDKEMRTFNWAHVVPGKYLPCGTMQAAGASINWLKDELFNSQSSDDEINLYQKIDSIIQSSPAGAQGILFFPYLLGERSPRWNPNATGAFLGIKKENSQADIFRSVYEGVIYNLKIILDIIDIEKKGTVLTGGGAKSQVFAQILSDVFGLEVHIPYQVEEATSIGAAICAGVGINLYRDFSVVSDFIKIKKTILPDLNNNEIYKSRIELFNQIYDALEPFSSKLNVLDLSTIT